MPELTEKDVDHLPVLKATCLKFIFMFFNQIPQDHTQNFLGLLSEFLKSMNLVNQSYAAACIEKLLAKKDKNGMQLLKRESVDQNIIMSLLSNLCNLLSE